MTTSPGGVTLLGALSADRWIDTGEELPGGGALNMAWHLTQRGVDVEVISRVATRDRPVFEAFLQRHGIAVSASTWVDGPSCTVDVRIGADRQPWMDHFVEGVWSTFDPTADEVALLGSGRPAVLVLVDVVDAALHRLAGAGALGSARLFGDFLSFRHFDLERFEATIAHLEVGFVGWPGDPADELPQRLGEVARRSGAVLVTTHGAQGIRVHDGRDGGAVTWFDVEARPVGGTTIGCGDAFIAGFVHEWCSTGDLDRAVASGAHAGADATAHVRPLPDEAYGPEGDG